MSTIKLNSLQASHKSQEVEKIAKIKELEALKQERDFLQHEEKQIGDYIKNLDVGDPLEVEHPKSVEGMMLYSEELNIKNK